MQQGIRNKGVYEMYKGKMCMKHTVEIFTPITDEAFGYKMFIGQLENSEAHKQSMNDINTKIQDVLGDSLAVDIGTVQTTVMFGKPLEKDSDEYVLSAVI